MAKLDETISRALGVPLLEVADSLGYQSVPEWDSLGHVRVIMAIEREFRVHVPEAMVAKLVTVAAIRMFVETGSCKLESEKICEVQRGLDGVYVDYTKITRIETASGELEYRGYSIHELVEQCSFEEVSHLLLRGELPNSEELKGLARAMRARAILPQSVLDLVRHMSIAHPIDALRTSISALGALTRRAEEETAEQAGSAGLDLIAQIPVLIAAHHAARCDGRDIDVGDGGFSHAARLGGMLLGRDPSPNEISFFERDLILHADHGSNASAFAARVALSCHATIHEAITAALATFAGPLHGGAIERVTQLIDDVEEPDRAAMYVRDCLAAGRPIVGFGHRVYKGEDPRVRHIRDAAERLSRSAGNVRELRIIEAVEEAMRPLLRHGIAPNVDLYAGLAYRLLGIPSDLSVPLFAAGRVVGWVAQAIEQKNSNVLIRPLLRYVGPASRHVLRPRAE